MFEYFPRVGDDLAWPDFVCRQGSSSNPVAQAEDDQFGASRLFDSGLLYQWRCDGVRVFSMVEPPTDRKAVASTKFGDLVFPLRSSCAS